MRIGTVMARGAQRGAKSVSGPSSRTNAAMSRAASSRSRTLTTSFGECMYRFGTETIPLARIEELVLEHFDLRPAAIIRALDLRRPIYKETAAYGHFGRKEFAWEAVDRADELRRAVS